MERRPVLFRIKSLLFGDGIRIKRTLLSSNYGSKVIRHTRRSYLSDWTRFCTECRELFGIYLCDHSPESLAIWTEELILAWLRWHEQADQSLDARTRAGRNASRKRILAALSSYATYLVRRKFISQSPVEGLIALHSGLLAHERSEALTPEEMQILLAAVEKRPSNPSKRLSASLDLAEVVIWSLLTVGMRVSELTGLSMKDFVRTHEGHRLVLSLKGGVAHDPLINPITAEKIRNYCSRYRENALGGAPLFVRVQTPRTGPRPLSQFGVYRIVMRSLALSGVKRNISPHGLRATLATALVRQHVPLAHIRDLLGHQSIQTTSVYVKRAQAQEEAATLQLDTDKLFGIRGEMCKGQ